MPSSGLAWGLTLGGVVQKKPPRGGSKVDPREALEVCGLTHPSISSVSKTLASPRVAPASTRGSFVLQLHLGVCELLHIGRQKNMRTPIGKLHGGCKCSDG
jgi:hypothetical protein